ncbi:uncharacterized protein LOC112340470 [Selaginella moellendorffii]|uniref:uncharacterized protein LOC112340470 n=1 Tax=Selaginella moellendorffii TaxID=88036 RepID=UPI000D1C2691|nr:uncharacterized protein LOC112340470 [Selaginella moellendorffii]|eukprot:XP_024544258.1 uncharacterized protein LOC112340470 [Selaginella moellendorffii]
MATAGSTFVTIPNSRVRHCSWQHKSKQLGLQVRAVSSEEEEFEARLARIQRKSAAGKKAAARKAKKLEGSGGASKGGKALLLPPVPLEDAISEGLVVELGFNPYTERLNGRFAMLGLAALLLVELATGSSFVKYHEAAIIGIQAYTMLAIAALFVKYEKEKRSVWPPQA